MTGQWRVFVGDWSDGEPPHEWVHLDERGLTWETARHLIRQRLQRHADGDDPYVAEQAASDLTALDALPPGTPWQTNVDGYDHVLAPDR